MKLPSTFVIVCLLLAACAVPRPTVKIALVAPFEGRLRQVGYDAFPALRLAIRDAIQAGGVGGYNVTFVAYNDNGDAALAERVAHDVAIDPEVVAVIGNWVPTTTLAALHVYTEAGLPVLAPGLPADALPQDALVFRMGPTEKSHKSRVTSQACGSLSSRDPGSLKALPEAGSGQFSIFNSQFDSCTLDAPPVSEVPNAADALRGFTDITLGTPPAPRSVVAFDATNVVLDAIRMSASSGNVTRAGVADALRRVSHRGLLGTIAFDATGVWADAPLWEYKR